MVENSGQQAIDALAEIIEQQQRLVPFCAADNTTANLLLDTLDEALIYARHEIQVLVTGAFASGKASLLKALFGEEYPSSSMPFPGALIEHHYGEEQYAIVYPRKGVWRGGDRPVKIALKELKNYYLFYNLDAISSSIESPFERVKIFSPNSILEQGVAFVEPSATTFDPDFWDQRKFILNTDIVLYTVSGTRALSDCDFENLKRLKTLLGPSFPVVIVITMFSMVSQEEKKRFTDYVRGIALPYTSALGVDTIYFVDGWTVRKAKQHDDQVLLSLSGFDRLASDLTDILIAKIRHSRMKDVIQQIERINEQLSTQIEKQYSVDIPDEERTSGVFRDRSEELLGAQMQIELIKQELNGLSEYFE